MGQKKKSKGYRFQGAVTIAIYTMNASKKKTTQKKPNGSSRAAPSGQISDARFAKFETDPRFRLPSRRKAKTALDKRFAHMLDDEEFTGTTQIDRYGRKIKSDKKKKALERLYKVADEDEDEEDEDEDEEDDLDDDKKIQRELQRIEKTYDPARGGGFSASESDSDLGSNDSDSDDSAASGESDAGEGGSKSADTQRFREEEAEVAMGEVTNRIAVVNLDWDHLKSRDLMAMFASFLPKDSSGRIERISIYPSEFGKERMQREELEGPPREIFKKKRGGDDGSDDGSGDSEVDSDDDEKVKQDLLREEDDEEVDGNALRSYQLDRLRYYYAVMVCSDMTTAEAIYRATDGHEYQASSNFIDLRFIPDDVTFDEDEPRDECTEVPSNYKPVDFVTEALQHSKVKLTWDMHPEDASRKDLVKKAFSGTPSELIENDLRAYLASGSEDEGEDEEEAGLGGEDEGVEVVDSTVVDEVAGEKGDGAEQKEGTKAAKPSKKELARQKMRAALGLAPEPTKSSSSSKREKAAGEMQITFTPALSESSKKKKAQEAEEETTIEKYKRKEKERKEKKRQIALAKREGREVSDAGEDAVEEQAAGGEDGEGEDLGFDDPFFTAEDAAPAEAAAPAGQSKTAQRKEERLKKRTEREAEAKEKAAERAMLEALMAEDDGAAVEHYDLREVMRAEKAKKKKAKKGKKGKKGRGLDEEADADEETDKPPMESAMDMEDPRFQAVFDDPEFAIDPSSSRFKDTPGMQQVLAEMRRKRRGEHDGEDEDGREDGREAGGGGKKAKKAKTAKTAAGPSHNDELASLVNAVKRKARKP